VYRNGAAADRARKSQRISQLIQMQRKKEVRTKTYDMLRSFEEHARSLKKDEPVDNLPLNAEASTMRQFGTTLPDALSESSDDSPVVHHARRRAFGSLSGAFGLNGLNKSSSDSYMVRDSGEHVLEADDHLHARRPPSPLAFYDYGNISLKPRSAFSQQRCGASEDAQSKHKPGSSCSFYFPGPDYKQGPYGFSMLDPIFMPPRCWEPRRGPLRSDQHANDVRPRHVRGSANDGTLRQSHISKPTVSDAVRSTRGHNMKTQHVARVLDRNHDEASLEKELHEDGCFRGRWCHPLRSKPAGLGQGSQLHDGPLDHHDWMQQDLSDQDEAAAVASRVLSGITRALQENHSTVPHLFRAHNHGAQGALEIEEFMEGLVRLQVLGYEDVTSLKVLSEAMTLIDPDFDGRVNYPALNRAVAAAQNAQRKQRRARSAGHSRGSMVTSAIYGAELPIDVVKVDRNSKSVYDFNRSQEVFQRQQTALLAHHGEQKADY